MHWGQLPQMVWQSEEVRESNLHESVRGYPNVFLSMLHPPLKAVGVGTNWKLAQRAGKLMMAATIVATARPELGRLQYVEMPVLANQMGIPNPTGDMAFQRIVIMTAVLLRVESSFMFSPVRFPASGISQPLPQSESDPASDVAQASGSSGLQSPSTLAASHQWPPSSEDTVKVSQSLSPWA